MTHYMLTIYQPGLDGEAPPDDVLEPIMREVEAVQREMLEAGVRMYGGGLQAPNTAAVLRPGDTDAVPVDGPYLEGKEHIGGFTIIETADRHQALAWGRKLADATTLPVEVRPLYDGSCG